MRMRLMHVGVALSSIALIIFAWTGKPSPTPAETASRVTLYRDDGQPMRTWETRSYVSVSDGAVMFRDAHGDLVRICSGTVVVEKVYVNGGAN